MVGTAIVQSDEVPRLRKLAAEADKAGITFDPFVKIRNNCAAGYVISPQKEGEPNVYFVLVAWDPVITRWVIRCECQACTPDPAKRTKAGEPIPSQICKHGSRAIVHLMDDTEPESL